MLSVYLLNNCYDASTARNQLNVTFCFVNFYLPCILCFCWQVDHESSLWGRGHHSIQITFVSCKIVMSWIFFISFGVNIPCFFPSVFNFGFVLCENDIVNSINAITPAQQSCLCTLDFNIYSWWFYQKNIIYSRWIL